MCLCLEARKLNCRFGAGEICAVWSNANCIPLYAVLTALRSATAVASATIKIDDVLRRARNYCETSL